MWHNLVLINVIVLITNLAHAQLTLNQYLDDVKKHNLSYQGSKERSEGASLNERDADLIFSPQLFAEFQKGKDGKLSSPPVMVYDERKSEAYTLGIAQQFSFGLQAKVSYELFKTDFVNANFGPGIANTYWDAAPKLELTLPLWKDGFGRSSRATRDLVRSQSLAEKYNSAAKAESILIEAETAYWRLSAAREQLKVLEQALKAAKNIFNYVSDKSKKNLGERADVLQARALVESYELQVHQAKNEVKSAQRNFNAYLNRDTNLSVPELAEINYSSLEKVEVPIKRPGDHLSVKAAELQTKAAQASSKVAYEKNRPALDIYSSYKFNGRADDKMDAIEDARSTHRETAYVGLKFNMPLNIFAASDTKEGALKQKLAAEHDERYLRYVQEQNWNDLVEQLSNAKETLLLTNKIEQSQKAKLDNERTRLRQGRTTTYQVLLFEQEYSQAQATRVKSGLQILALQQQIKLYKASM